MPSRPPTSFGVEILRLMAAAGMHRQIDLAEAADLSASTVSRLIYSDEITPDVRTFDRLAKALNAQVPDLITHFDETFRSIRSERQLLPNEIARIAAAYFSSRDPHFRNEILTRVRWIAEWAEAVGADRERREDPPAR